MSLNGFRSWAAEYQILTVFTCNREPARWNVQLNFEEVFGALLTN